MRRVSAASLPPRTAAAIAMRFAVVGIDLGTTNSCVATVKNGNPCVLDNEEGHRTTPSIVAFTKDGTCVVGAAARRQAVTNPKSTFYAVKRLIGRRFDDPQTQKDIKALPYKIVNSPRGDAWVADAKGQSHSPSQIGAHVLRKMKETAERHTNGEAVTDAVVTVPAYFSDAQRQATKDAGKIAGLNVLRIINEPTAAALAFGLDRGRKELKVAVYDLGGGTFDISVLEMADGVFQVLATSGDTHLGGEDFDELIADHLLKAFKKSSGMDMSNDPNAKQRLREAAEKAKCELSTRTQTDINIPYLAQNAEGPQHLQVTLTRKELEDMCEPLVQRSLEPCKRAMRDADIHTSEIDEVILVGGMTRMPRVVDAVKTLFKKEPFQGVNPDEAVALGAAILGDALRGKELTKGGGNLSTQRMGDVRLLDVTPLSLGVNTVGDIFSRIIPKNTTIPATRTKEYTTVEDGQRSVNFEIYQGERDIASANARLGRAVLDDLPIAPRGVPKVDVTFEIDVDGICKVKAVDRATKRSVRTVVQSNGGLSQTEIDKMIKEAQQFAEKDKQNRAFAEAKNEADNQLYSADKALKEFQAVGDKEKNEIRDAMNELRNVTNNTNASKEDLESATKKLRDLVVETGRADYQARAGGNTGGDQQQK